jgi:LPS sulfotransferase NodH
MADASERALRLRVRAAARLCPRRPGPGLDDLVALARRLRRSPTSCFLLCGTPRTGSTLLAELLASSGSVGLAREYFASQCEPEWTAAGYGQYVASVKRFGARNGVFGAKVFWYHLTDMLPRLRAELGRRSNGLGDGAVLARTFPNPSYVWIRRRDVVAQAVSWSKAEQAERWRHDHPVGDEPVFDFGTIDDLVARVRCYDDAWRGWFAANDVEPLEVVYEEVAADPVGVATHTLGFLGVPVVDPGAIRPSVERQADEVNAEWIARYLELKGSVPALGRGGSVWQ